MPQQYIKPFIFTPRNRQKAKKMHQILVRHFYPKSHLRNENKPQSKENTFPFESERDIIEDNSSIDNLIEKLSFWKSNQISHYLK